MAKTYIIPIDPMPAPRMVYSDRYLKKRPIVQRYNTYKQSLRFEHRIHLTKEYPDIELTFCIPMPKSWPKKKKAAMRGKFHQQTPDLDNLVKGFLDAVCDDDRHIYAINAAKFWWDFGQIGCKAFIEGTILHHLRFNMDGGYIGGLNYVPKDNENQE